MIFGQLKDWRAEEKAFSPAIREVMEYLCTTDFSTMAPGKHEIDGSRMFCMINAGTTQPREVLKAESHESYMDIQYVLEGEEKIGYARLTDQQVVTQNLIESDDAYLYEELQDEMELVLRAGTYAMFFPADLHRPGWKLEAEAPIRKAIIKIRLDF